MTDWKTAPIFAFDIESTGVDPTKERIVTACVVNAEGTREWLLNPEIEIPEGASAVHGVSTEKARTEGQDYAEGLAEILVAIHELWASGHALCIYNAPYDLTMLHHESLRVFGTGLEVNGLVLDPLVIDRAIDKYRRGKRTLGVTCEHYGVTLDNAHEAKADAVAAGRLAWKLRQNRALSNVPDIMLWQAAKHAEKQRDFAAYLRKQGKPSDDVSPEWPVRLS